MPKPRNGNNLTISHTDNNRCNTSKINFVWVQDSERHACATTGIDCVSTRIQDRISGCCGKIVTGGHGVTVTVESWTHIKFSVNGDTTVEELETQIKDIMKNRGSGILFCWDNCKRTLAEYSLTAISPETFPQWAMAWRTVSPSANVFSISDNIFGLML
jgi:hypothetical protein